MKQIDLFGSEYEKKSDDKYTSSIKAPIYTPRGIKPSIYSLYDKSKAQRLINEINSTDITDEDKMFLTLAAYRHIVFNYEQIADYYANSDVNVQRLMEKSALIIIDFDKAIQLGFVLVSEEIKEQYLTEYGE